MNKTKRVLSVVLAVLMLSSLIAALAIAEGQYTVIISYVFGDDRQAAPSWTATLAEGSNLKQTVTSPTVVGYEPNYVNVDIDVNNITENKTYTVTYYPANVGFTVEHYLQNVADNNYTLKESEHHDGKTEDAVGDGLANTYPGFAALLYNTKAKVAADGSTVVEIYYDRNYYMLSLNLDGGYGAEPVYARYGANVEISNPTKPGYTFAGWDPTLPATVPAENKNYTAKWTADKSANLTVVFWYENADDTNYSYAGSNTVQAAIGTEVSSGTYKDASFTGRDGAHFTYNSDKAETVTVKGDGSSVLNVYFTRNTYTLKFTDGTESVLTCGKEEHTHTYTGSYKEGGFLGIGATTYYYGGCYPAGGNDWGGATSGNTICGKEEHTHNKRNCYSNQPKVVKTITAKYGADIHGNFPIKDGEKTIWWTVPKGTQTYGEFDKQRYLGSVDIMPGENITFTRYSSYSDKIIYYYVETLNGETGKYSHDEKQFKLYKSISCQSSGNLTYSEEFHDITGFTQWWSDPAFDKMEQGGKTSGIKEENFLCYTRNSYKLKFLNYGVELTDKEKSVQYEAALKGYDFIPSYPTNLEANAYEFAGWYTTEKCIDGTEMKWDTAKMPASDVLLYAKWAPKTHTVRTYLTDAMDTPAYDSGVNEWTVAHRSTIEEPATPENGNYTFVGWFYKENGVEKAFNFSMAVTNDLDLYAKWSSNTLVEYTIKYTLENGTEIAAETTGSALAGTTLTFEAKTGNELNAPYNERTLFPKTGSHSLTMDIEGKNEFTFVYVEKEKVGYTVRYLDKDTNAELHEEKNAETSNAIITEKFEVVPGYMPDRYQKRLVLSADAKENVITFWYTKDEQHATILKNYWLQNADGNGYSSMPYREISEVGNIGTEYTAEVIDITGFTYNANPTNAHADHTALASGTLTANGLELNMYYDRNTIAYTVKHLNADTKEEIASKSGTALFGAQVTGYEGTFDGYMPIEDQPKQKFIRIDTGTNEIIFYYYPCYYIGHVQSGSLHHTDTIRLTSSSANLTAAVTSGYLYGGAFRDPACETVQEFKPGENAINFTPEKGETYYIWEVSETYLKPRAYVVSRHDPVYNGQWNVVGLYLTSSVDRNMYQLVGFEMGSDADYATQNVYTKVQAVYTDTGDVKEEMYVNSNGDWDVQKKASTSTGGYVSMYKVEMSNMSQNSTVTYRPYWVTLDGIKVTGAYSARTCTYRGPGYSDIEITQLVQAKSEVSSYSKASTQTVAIESVGVLNAAPETADVPITPDVPETPVVPEVPEAPDMTLNSDAMYLRAQYTYEMMTNTAKFISAIDVNACTEYGFVINGEVIKCEEAAETVDGYSAAYLFGESVNGAMLMSCNMLLDGLVDGMTINVTPYCIDLNGNVVYGETRTLVYRQWVGLEG